MIEATIDARRAIHKLNVVGFTAILTMAGGFLLWASTGQLAGAVITQGSIVVETEVKKIQHPSGGIIGEIRVKEGDLVKAGDVVARLDETVPKATLGVIRSQLEELLARQARLTAERDDAKAVEFPDQLALRAKTIVFAATISSEERLFDSRREARVGQRSQLRQRVAQSDEEIRGLSAQRDAKDAGIKLIVDELVGVQALYDKKLVSISRLMMLLREKARLDGERGQLVAEIARARGKISETELQIIQIDQDFRSDVLKDLREVQGKVAELRERYVAAEDQLKRIDIRAPETGYVLQLSVHTVGGVIAAGETIMQIVPNDDGLVVEAKVTPQDIDQLVVGANAIVRIMAGNQRTAPDLQGSLTRVSADLARDPPVAGQPGQAYYVVRIALPRVEVQRLADFRLVPGMPAEAFIHTYPRTVMEYLVKPLRDQIARTFRER